MTSTTDPGDQFVSLRDINVDPETSAQDFDVSDVVASTSEFCIQHGKECIEREKTGDREQPVDFSTQLSGMLGSSESSVFYDASCPSEYGSQCAHKPGQVSTVEAAIHQYLSQLPSPIPPKVSPDPSNNTTNPVAHDEHKIARTAENSKMAFYGQQSDAYKSAELIESSSKFTTHIRTKSQSYTELDYKQPSDNGNIKDSNPASKEELFEAALDILLDAARQQLKAVVPVQPQTSTSGSKHVSTSTKTLDKHPTTDPNMLEGMVCYFNGSGMKDKAAGPSTAKQITQETIQEMQSVVAERQPNPSRLKRVRRKTQTSPEKLNGETMTELMCGNDDECAQVLCPCRPVWTAGDELDFPTKLETPRARLPANDPTPQNYPQAASLGPQSQAGRNMRYHHTRAASPNTIPDAEAPHDDFRHEVGHRLRTDLPTPGEGEAYGENPLLIPVRTTGGQLSLLSLLDQFNDQFASQRRRSQRASTPHITRAPINCEVSQRANSADDTPGVVDFEPWSAYVPLHRTEVNVQSGMRWNVTDTSALPRNPRRGADRRAQTTNQIRLLNAGYPQDTPHPLPPNLTSAILNNYPDIYRLFEAERRLSTAGHSLPLLHPLPKHTRDRVLSGPGQLETHCGSGENEQVYLSTQEEGRAPVNTKELSHIPTDLSLPAYHPVDDSINWARLYITTANNPYASNTVQDSQPSQSSSGKSSQSKRVSWSLTNEQPVYGEYKEAHPRKLSNHRDSLEILSAQSSINRLTGSETDVHRKVVHETPHPPLDVNVFTFRLTTSSIHRVVTIARPVVTTTSRLSEGVLQRAKHSIRKERVLFNLQHEKAFILKEDLVAAIELRPVKIKTDKAEQSIGIIHHSFQHLEESRQKKIWTLLGVKEKLMDRVEFKTTKLLRPVKTGRVNGDPEDAATYDKCIYSVTKSSMTAIGKKTSSSGCIPCGRSINNTDQGTTTDNDDEDERETMLEKLRREYQEQALALQEKHGVKNRFQAGPDNSSTMDAEALIGNLKEVLENHKKHSVVVKLLRELHVASEKGDDDFEQFIENEEDAEKDSRSDMLVSPTLLRTDADIQTPSKGSLASLKKESQTCGEGLVPEGVTIMNKLDILHDQQNVLSSMVDQLNKTVEVLGTNNAGVAGNTRSQHSSMELSRRESDGAVVLSVDNSMCHHTSLNMHNRMDKIISDWSTRKKEFPSTNTLTVERQTTRNSLKGINDLCSRKQWLSENVRRKVQLLRQTVADLEAKLAGRPDIRRDSLPMILDILRTTMESLTAQ